MHAETTTAPDDSAAIIAGLHSDAPQTPFNPDFWHSELERVSEALIRETRKKDAQLRWEDACPDLLKSSDWSHARLAPFRAQIDRVLGYKFAPKGILASGPTGRGKTRSMWALMRRLAVEDGYDVRYWSSKDWFCVLQEQVRYGRDEARGWVDAIARRQILFIDDLGQEAVQANREDWAQGWLFRLLDIRVGLGLPLFVTTNLTSTDMVSRAGSVRGDPLVRRLMDLCEPVKFE